MKGGWGISRFAGACLLPSARAHHHIQSRLSRQLDDFRKVDNDLQQALHILQASLLMWCISTYPLTSLQVDTKRGDRALAVQLPRIQNELDDSMEVLTKLGVDLPQVQSQVNTIAEVYLSGHATVSPSLSTRLDRYMIDLWHRPNISFVNWTGWTQISMNGGGVSSLPRRVLFHGVGRRWCVFFSSYCLWSAFGCSGSQPLVHTVPTDIGLSGVKSWCLELWRIDFLRCIPMHLWSIFVVSIAHALASWHSLHSPQHNVLFFTQSFCSSRCLYFYYL